MTKSQAWIEYFTARLIESERELANFNEAVKCHGLKIRVKCGEKGEEDITDASRRDLEKAVDDYRRALRDD